MLGKIGIRSPLSKLNPGEIRRALVPGAIYSACDNSIPFESIPDQFWRVNTLIIHILCVDKSILSFHKNLFYFGFGSKINIR